MHSNLGGLHPATNGVIRDTECSPNMSSIQQVASEPIRRLRKPAIDPEHIVIEPVLCVMHNSITPFTRISAGVYDFANRRWYELNVEQEIEDEEWIASKVRHYMNGAVEPFNSISIDEKGDVTLELKDNSDVARPIRGIVEYHGPLSTTRVATILKRKHLSGRVDTCQWKGQVCAYKCLDFEEDIKKVLREIWTRETIQEKLSDHIGVAPILAVVLEPSTQFIDGILLPLYHSTLEGLANDNTITLQSCTASSRRSTNYFESASLMVISVNEISASTPRTESVS